MRSLRVVLLLMSPECPRRVLLIWEVKKPTCQRFSVAASCLAMTSWRNHLQWSAPWLALPHTQLHSSAEPGSIWCPSLCLICEPRLHKLWKHKYRLPTSFSRSTVFCGCPAIPNTHTLAWWCLFSGLKLEVKLHQGQARPYLRGIAQNWTRRLRI